MECWNPVMPTSARRYLLPYEKVVKYLGFAKSVADSKGFRGILPKYLTTTGSSGILKRYHLEETAIASFFVNILLGCKWCHFIFLTRAWRNLRWELLVNVGMLYFLFILTYHSEPINPFSCFLLCLQPSWLPPWGWRDQHHPFPRYHMLFRDLPMSGW